MTKGGKQTQRLLIPGAKGSANTRDKLSHQGLRTPAQPHYLPLLDKADSCPANLRRNRRTTDMQCMDEVCVNRAAQRQCMYEVYVNRAAHSSCMRYVLTGQHRGSACMKKCVNQERQIRGSLLLLQNTWLHSQYTHGSSRPTVTRFFRESPVPSHRQPLATKSNGAHLAVGISPCTS